MAEKDRLTQAQIDAFVRAWAEGGGSPKTVARVLGWEVRRVYSTRAKCCALGVVLTTASTGHPGDQRYGWQAQVEPYKDHLDFTLKGCCAFFFGDAHYHPGEPPLAHQALLKLAPKLKPRFIAANGDIIDGAAISRHDPLGWVKTPRISDELDIARTRLDEIKRAAPDASLFYSPGNHCSRLDRWLATNAAELEGMPGLRLQDHIKWPMAYVGVINRDTECPVLVMHNFRGGVHATWNNTIHAGCTIITGHLHSQDRKAHTSYFKTTYGVDHGMLADPDHEAFAYTMGRPKNWRSGFCVMTFDEDGRHLPPEFLEIQRYSGYDRAVFRGETILERHHETVQDLQRRKAAI